MKISKLFHWLYAILMLFPFVFFVPSVLYYAFNDNATMQTVEVPKTETISVDFNQKIPNGDFVDKSYWTLNNNSVASFTVSGNVANIVTYSVSDNSYLRSSRNIINGHTYYAMFSAQLNEAVNGSYAYFRVGTLASTYFSDNSVSINFDTYSKLFTFVGESGQYDVQYGLRNSLSNSMDYNLADCQLFDLTQMFGSGNEPTIAQFNEWFPNAYYPYTESELMQITYDTVETEQLVSNTDIINYAWESIWDLPLFNWCKVSFVSVPFTYITGLFGLAASNSFNYVFTYFASMSIIWLVFDVIMYVPLLVHRWLDKGIVE